MSGDLEQVRSELKRLGYLSHGLERYLLQDALRPQRPARTLALLTLKVALPAGLVLALVAAFALAAANGNLTATPFDLLALFAHLVPPAVLAAAGGFLALAGVVMLVLRLSHVRRIEALSLAAAVAAVVGLLALAAPRAADLFAGSRPWQVVALAAGVPAVAYVLVKLVNQGLLSLAIRLTDATPRWRLFSRRWASLAVLAAGFLLTLPTVLAARRGAPPPAPALPTAPGERVLLVGIDGVLAEELDYLLAMGDDLPVLGRLAREGGVVLRYARGEEPPAALWTSVATGLPSPDHGVAALDTFRPRGVATPLARVGPLRPYFARVAVPLGLAEHRALLANRRRAWAVWELAARGGAPVVAVDWWATFPAAPVPGLVVAHGAYQLLAGEPEAVAGAVSPEAARAGLAELRAAVAGNPPRELAAALPPAAAQGVFERAIGPDRFYRAAFAQGLAEKPRAAALYLPGLDIAADGWAGGDVAFADLVRAELAATDRLIGGALDGVGTVAIVVDPGRRGPPGAEGRVILWRRNGCDDLGDGTERIEPEEVAAALLRALGLPQSQELPPPPTACRWEPPAATVAAYGEPDGPRPQGAEGGEYLENLRSLGYL